MTFALGLASVFIFNGSLKYSDEIPADLPKTQSESSVIVFPRHLEEMPPVSRGRIYPRYEIQKKTKLPK